MSLFRCDHPALIAQLRADLAMAETAAANWERLHELERRRYDELLQTLLAMKTKGAEVVAVAGSVVEPPAPIPAQEPDELKALIHAIAGDDSRKRGMMLRQLKVDRAAGVKEEDIEAAIRSGVTPDGVPA